MTLEKYQESARKTAIYPGQRQLLGLIYCMLGLSSEVGEVHGKLKKIIRDKGAALDKEDTSAILDEVGDCLWYLAMVSEELGSSLEKVATNNLSKLFKRQRENKLGGSGDKR